MNNTCPGMSWQHVASHFRGCYANICKPRVHSLEEEHVTSAVHLRLWLWRRLKQTVEVRYWLAQDAFKSSASSPPSELRKQGMFWCAVGSWEACSYVDIFRPFDPLNKLRSRLFGQLRPTSDDDTALASLKCRLVWNMSARRHEKWYSKVG